MNAEWIGVVASTGLVTLLVRLFWTGVWSYVYSQKSQKGREHSRDPRIVAMISMTILSISQFVIMGIMWQPRPNGHEAGWPEVYAILVWGVFDQTFLSVYTFWLSSAAGWVVDEDIHYQSTRGGKRREGFYKAVEDQVNAISKFIAIAWINSYLFGDNAVCNTNYSIDNQKPDCGQAFFILYLVFHPSLRLIQVLLMYFFPITGERLKTLYRRQAQVHKVLAGSSSEKELIELKKMKLQYETESAATIAPATFKVVLPDGAAPGMQLQYPLSNGTNVTVVVPEGKGPGDELLVPIPPVTTTTINTGDNKGTGTI